MDLLADEDADRRRAGQPVRLDVPARAREHAWRAAAMPVKFDHRRAGREADGGVRGSPSASSTQRSATASIAAAAGELTRLKAFWSQAEASQSAPSAAGSAPPVTKPK